MSTDFLVDHAKTHVWCAPEQDKQVIYKPARVSSRAGFVNYGYVMGRKIDMPVNSKTYHVFSIGQVNPGVLSIKKYNPDFISEHWVSFKDSINDTGCLTNIYTGAGKEIPKFSSYYMYTHERCLLVCIEEDSKFKISYSTDDIYIRFYNNIYFETDAPVNANHLHCEGKKCLTTIDVLNLQVAYINYLSKPGHVFCYRNGYIVDGIDVYTVTPGDVAEFIYDPTVKKKVTFTLGNLSVFDSELDHQYKYLLHYPDVEAVDQIDFEDDIDVHVIYNHLPNRFNGYYYHRNNDASHRMVTHRDYSVSVNHFMHIANNLMNDLSLSGVVFEEIKLQLVIRQAGDQRSLVLENQRLFELYKLDDLSVYRAMIGLDATVSEWNASNLENSGYVKVMAVQENEITRELVQQAYGYNACSVLYGQTPQLTVYQNSRQTSQVPYGLVNACTVYEYDSQGVLLGYYPSVNSTDYECVNSSTRLVEMYSGEGTYQPLTVYGEDHLPIPSTEYRVYKCEKISGIANQKWKDITGSSLYVVQNHQVVWNSSQDLQWLMIRRFDSWLTYTQQIQAQNGVLKFTLTENALIDGQLQTIPVIVPYGDMDVFLNGYSLIKGLDYFVDLPEVYIVNKTRLNYPSESALQQIVVRCHGFCDEHLVPDAIEDYGFVEHGVLSNNNVYDIRDDKVLRITVDGKTLHRSQLEFSEFYVGVQSTHNLNGKPYQIKDIVVPIEGLMNEDTYSFRKKSMLIDNKVSDYMTLKKPQPARPALNVIAQRYRLYSPFLSKILDSFDNGSIPNSNIMGIQRDNEVLDFCKPYEYLLKVDPIGQTPNLNTSYVHIQPHCRNTAISLNMFQYNLFVKIVRLYGKGLIELNPLVNLST